MAEILANNLIRLIVTVAILGAVYLFAIKPILDTTNDAIDQAFEPFNGIQQEIQDSFDDAGLDSFDVNSIDVKGGNTKKLDRLQACVQKAGQNVDKLNACVERFEG